MKKALLSLALLAGATSFAFGESVIFNFADPASLTPAVELPDAGKGTTVTDTEFTNSGVTITATKGSANDAVIWNTSGNYTYRVYRGASITVTAPEAITSIVFACGNGNFTTEAVSANSGSITVNTGEKSATWIGSADKVVFSITDGSSNYNQQIVSVTVNYGEGTDVPVVSGDIYAESFASSLGDFTIENVELPSDLTYVWSWASGYGAKASAYVKSIYYETESWLISPLVDISGYSNVVLSFDHATNFFTGNVAPDYTGVYVRTSENGEWTDITSKVNYPASQSWAFVNSGDISLADFENGSVQVGFKYTSDETIGGTWEIKNFSIAGEKNSSSIQAVEAEGVNAPVEYFNLQGVKVTNPQGGVFIQRQGDSVSKVIR